MHAGWHWDSPAFVPGSHARTRTQSAGYCCGGKSRKKHSSCTLKTSFRSALMSTQNICSGVACLLAIKPRASASAICMPRIRSVRAQGKTHLR